MEQTNQQSASKQSSKLKKLCRQIESEFKEVQTTCEEFPSGSASLDVKIRNSFFILEYRQEMGFGLSCIPQGDHAWDAGYDEIFTRFTGAKTSLLSHLRRVEELNKQDVKKKSVGKTFKLIPQKKADAASQRARQGLC